MLFFIIAIFIFILFWTHRTTLQALSKVILKPYLTYSNLLNLLTLTSTLVFFCDIIEVETTQKTIPNNYYWLHFKLTDWLV